MAKLLYRIGRSAYLHRWRFIAVWLIILVGAGVAGVTMQKNTTMNMTIPGLESVDTQDEMQQRFPDQGDELTAPTGTIVVRAPEGEKLSDPAVKADLDSLVKDIRAQSYLKDTDQIVDPITGAAGTEQMLTKQMTPQLKAQGLSDQQVKDQIASDVKDVSPLSPDGRTGTFDVNFDVDTATDVNTSDAENLENLLKDHRTDNLDISYSGTVFQLGAVQGGAEIIGIIIAALILIITFGSFLAAGLPLITALVGVGTGIMLITAGTALTDSINDMTPTLASMIGLAVGIDYALFIVSRFRNELIAAAGGNNMTPAELKGAIKKLSFRQRAHLAGLAVGKAGSAVCFAGLTVIIALVALWIINIPFLTAMALAAAGTVLIAVLVAITLLPAILGAFGTKAFAARAPYVKAPDPEDEKPTMGLKWVRQVRKRPVAFLIGGVVLLGILAAPVGGLKLAMPTDGTSNLGSPARTSYEWIDEGFGPGRNAPMIALVTADDLGEKEAQQSFAAAAEQIGSVDGVQHTMLAGMSEDGKSALVKITPEYGATDEKTSDTLKSIRDGEETFHDKTGAKFAVAGVTPIYDDVSARLSDVLIPYIAIVVVLAFIILMIVFRSLWVPLIAALGFALSVGATFGATVAIWQWGWLGITNDPQPIISFLPIMLIGIVFGLAMDYQVFLVTRMREGYVHGKTAGNAVSNGFKHGARVVTAAALIMISVFAAFMTMDENFIKVMGSALAMAVFFDAFIVRMVIVPASLFLLGDRAWKLPKWLDRILPKVDVEGEGLIGLEAPEEEQKATVGAGTSDD
ncbi:MMPL family transporter [Corynebacterium nuruki]|uniref:MMPL family transporter n=1 Tax=Corynebacterium nuruki TaxID=1032851 RepID=UPI002FE1941F